MKVYVAMTLMTLSDSSLEKVQNSKPNKKRKHLFAVLAVLINYSAMGGVYIGARALLDI